MQRLQILITGLCPDFGTQTEEVLSKLAGPALHTLLGRGRKLEATTGIGLSHRLAQLFNLPVTPELPFAPLRLQADGIDPGEGQWWCADPVHMQLMLDHLRMGGGSSVSLAAEDAAALVATLNQHFAGEVEFLAPSPLRWYARFSRPMAAQTTPLDQARGQSVRPCLPRDSDGAHLQRLMNEAQMLLHEHPVNLSRESQGLEPINSIWFWGGGQGTTPPPSRHHLLADNPVALALARAAGSPAQPLPARFEPANYSDADLLVVLDSLLPLSCDGRIEAWQAELGRLEDAWFRPIRHALKRGWIGELCLESLGPRGQTAQLGRIDIWKFWQPPGALCPPLSR